jgi:hypothetical protein
MANEKVTKNDLIDGITGGTAKMFKDTEKELYKQRLKLEELFKKTGVDSLFAGIERDVKAAGNAAQSITDPKKFKANIFDKLWLSFQTEFPKFIKNTASKFEPITKPVSKAIADLSKGFNKSIVQPILKPLTKSVKAIDTLINKVVVTPLKATSSAINGIVKSLSVVLPGATNLVKVFVPFIKIFGKILPFIGLVFDYLSAEAQTKVLETQQRQIDRLYNIVGDLRVKQAGQTVTLNKILSAVGSGSRAGAGLTDADRQAIANTIIYSLKPLISGNKTDLSGVNGQLSKISGQVSAIQPAKQPDLSGVTAQILKVGAQVAAIKPTVDLSGVNSQLTQIKGQIAAIPAAIPKQTVDLSGLTAQIRQVSTQISTIPAPTVDLSRVNDRLTQISGQVSAISVPEVNLSGVMSQLTQINGQVSRIPTAPVDISGVNRQLANIASTQNAISAAALSAAVVTSLRPLIQQNTTGIEAVNANVARVDAKLRSPLMAIDPEVRAAAARIEQRVTASGQVINAVDDKLGAKVTGGLSGKLARIGKIMQFDRIINMLTLITVLHNASMLASSLGQTLGSLTSEALAVVGIKDEEGSAIDINGILSKQADGFIISIIGQEAWNGVKTNWNKANRVISSATNVIWTVRSMADSTRNVLEWTAENTGKIGNALKKARVVPENSYPWMAENVNAQSSWHRAVDKFSQGVGQIDETASSLASVVGDVRSVQSEFTELKTQKDEFKAALTAAAPKPAADNAPIKTESAAVTAISKIAPEIAKPDREEGNGVTE